LANTSKPTVLLVLLYVAFILYGTTIPFDFTANSTIIQANLRAIRWTAFQRAPGVRESIPDMISNVLLFIPLGVLITYAGLSLRKKRPIWAVLIFSVMISAGMSALVETLQILSPSRTTSLTDFLTNGMGAICGMAIALAFTRWMKDPLAAWLRREALRSPAMILLIVYFALLALGALAPLDVSLDVGSIKDGLKSARLDPLADPTPWSKALANVLWFAGLSYLLCHVLIIHIRRLGSFLTILASLAMSAFLAFGLELAQIFISSRVTTTRDVLAGLLGALYGGILFILLNLPVLTRRTEDHKPLQGRSIFWLVLVHYLIFLFHEALYPYDFYLPPAVSSVVRTALLPFSAYYSKTNVLALFDFLGGIARFSPLGFLIQEHGLPSGKRRKWAAILLCLGLGTVLESLQLGIAGRYADITDVIAAGCGGYVGWAVWRWWKEREGFFLVTGR
jgi:glycopeptide antibiotics resistance protein